MTKKRSTAKMLQADYDAVFAEKGEYAVCLTAAQIAWVLSQVEFAAWGTRWFSLTNTPIDQNKIDNLRDDLVFRLIETLSDCEEDTMYLLRQSPTDPCQLEQSTDGGLNWTLAFDYKKCSFEQITNPLLERINQDTMHYQVSPDDGETWVDLPDARDTTPVSPDPYASVDDTVCWHATNATLLVKELIEDSGETLLEIIGYVISVLIFILTGGVAAPIVAIVITAILADGLDTVREQLDDEAYEQIKNILFCNSDIEWGWTPIGWANALNEIAAEIPNPGGAAVVGMLQLMGSIGLSNAGHLHLTDEVDCSEAECGDCSNLEYWGVVYGTIIEQSAGYLKIQSENVGANQSVRIATSATGASNTKCCFVTYSIPSGVTQTTQYYACGSDTPAGSIPFVGACGHDFMGTNIFNVPFVMEFFFNECP